MEYKRASELNFVACSTISIFEHATIYIKILYRIKAQKYMFFLLGLGLPLLE